MSRWINNLGRVFSGRSTRCLALAAAVGAGSLMLGAADAQAAGGRRDRHRETSWRDRHDESLGERFGDRRDHGSWRDRRGRRDCDETDVRVNIDLGGGGIELSNRRWCEPVYEDRCTKVWVDPVYRTVVDRVWVDPVYTTECERVWVPPVVKTVCERVWVPDRYEVREYAEWCHGRRVVRRERVLVCAGYYENVHREIVVCEGRWEEVHKQVLVCAGHWENVERQELVCAGHWEERHERVLVREGHWADEPVARFDLDR